jgi:hypothetical protein
MGVDLDDVMIFAVKDPRNGLLKKTTDFSRKR